jgi:DNA polymerase III subunit beta
MQTTIRTSTIKAAIHCAAVNDTRYYLNGALFEFKHDHINIVSTDGHRLSAFREPLEYAAEAQTADYEFIIPLDVLKQAAKSKSPLVVLESTPDGRYMLNNVVFAPIDGKFPDYRRVIPTSFTGQAAQYRPEYLVDAKNALRDFYQIKTKDWLGTKLEQNGDSAGAVHCGKADAVVVIMPLRTYELEKIGNYQGFAE